MPSVIIDRPVENRSSPPFRFHAPRHKRALRGVETTDGTAGNRDEQTGENGAVRHERFASEPRRIFVQIAGRQVAPQLGNGGLLNQESDEQCKTHKQKREGEKRIDSADAFVDGQHGGDDVIDENRHNPEEFRAPDAVENDGRTIDEHHAHHDQQKHRENQHHAHGRLAEVVPHDFGLSGTVVTNREHSAQIVVDGSGENAAQDYPHIGHRPVPRTHDGTENRTRAGNVQKLNHENLPSRKHHEIYSVGLCNGGRRAVVGAENTLHETSIEKIACNQRTQGNEKCNHTIIDI